MTDKNLKSLTEYEKEGFEDQPVEEYFEDLDDGGYSHKSKESENSDDDIVNGMLSDRLEDESFSDIDFEESIHHSVHSEIQYTDNTFTDIELEVSSNAPSDFNSEEHKFHLNIVKKKSLVLVPEPIKKYKNGTRASLSFSNDRMREIDRHNRILLQRIVAKPPPPKKKELPLPRISSAAVNRKKQQRQIDLDNLVLKRKIEEIAKKRMRK